MFHISLQDRRGEAAPAPGKGETEEAEAEEKDGEGKDETQKRSAEAHQIWVSSLTSAVLQALRDIDKP